MDGAAPPRGTEAAIRAAGLRDSEAGERTVYSLRRPAEVILHSERAEPVASTSKEENSPPPLNIDTDVAFPDGERAPHSPGEAAVDALLRRLESDARLRPQLQSEEESM